MNHYDTLAVWEHACAHAQLPWSLFAETLLCANGYQHLPDSLSTVTVAIDARTLPELLSQVIPTLPGSWTVQETDFLVGTNDLLFSADGKPVLTVRVLFSGDDAVDTDTFFSQLFRFRIRQKRRTLAQKSAAFVQFASQFHSDFYLTSFSAAQSHAIPKEAFSVYVTLDCQGHGCPVFAGYRDYLRDVYGDYENGLFDSVGCGLTVGEKEELVLHQQRCREALAFLLELRKDYDLRFTLIAGSVLGPVRDGGIIPWDDDVDVGIRLEEIAEFERIVKEQLPLRLPEGFSLKQPGPNNPYPRMFSKICYQGRCCIDLWPLIPSPGAGLPGKLHWYVGKSLTKLHYAKIGHRISKYRRLFTFASHFLTDSMIWSLVKLNEKLFAKKNSPYYLNLYSIYKFEKELIRRDWLDAETEIPFHDLQVPVVGCTHDYLTHLYGSYMEKPKPWNRASRHIDRF